MVASGVNAALPEFVLFGGVKIQNNWGVPKSFGYLFGGPHLRDFTFWAPYWGPLILGNYQILFGKRSLRFKSVRVLNDHNESRD